MFAIHHISEFELTHIYPGMCSLLNEVWSETRKPGESPLMLYVRFKQLYDENLLRANGLSHVDVP